MLTFSKKKEYLHGRIDELSKQLDKANTKLCELRTTLGQVTAYNEILVHENEELKEAANSGKGRQRHHDGESDKGRQIK